MASIYFVDESGYSGDLVRAGTTFDFGAQPIFGLACVGDDDGASLAAEIDRLKAFHRIGLVELKAASLHGRPAFVADLLDMLAARQAPLLLEVVEKRFMVAIHLVNHQLMTGASHLGDPQGEALARALVEFLGQLAPTSVLRAFVTACERPSYAAVETSLRALAAWARGFRPAFELTEIVAGLASLGLEELEPEAAPDEASSYRRYLPSPDDGPSGKPMWMLPNLSCFTSVYARLNLAHGRRMAAVTIIHDEQRYVEGAIRDGKVAQEALAAAGQALRVPFADYDISESATLEFRRSADVIGLQVADVIAGVVTRHVKTVLNTPRAPRPLQDIFDRILRFTDPAEGGGVNFVATDRLIAACGVSTHPR